MLPLAVDTRKVLNEAISADSNLILVAVEREPAGKLR